MAYILFTLFVFTFHTLKCNAFHTVTVNQEICPDNDFCRNVENIFVPNSNEQCTEELLFYFGDGTLAYISADGKITSKGTTATCSPGFKTYKYPMKNVVIEVIKHDNSLYVKKINKLQESTTTVSHAQNVFIQFIHEKMNEFLQWIVISFYLLRDVLKIVFKKCVKRLLNR